MEELTPGTKLLQKFIQTDSMNTKPSRQDYKAINTEDVLEARRFIAVSKGVDTEEVEKELKRVKRDKQKTKKHVFSRDIENL